MCTNGAKGSDDESMSAAQLIGLRREEQRAAAQLLGVKDVFFLDNEDGELTPNRDFLRDRPSHPVVGPFAVFTHDPDRSSCATFVNHADHRATGLTAIDAVYPAARDRLNFPEQIVSVAAAAQGRRGLHMGLGPRELRCRHHRRDRRDRRSALPQEPIHARVHRPDLEPLEDTGRALRRIIPAKDTFLNDDSSYNQARS